MSRKSMQEQVDSLKTRKDKLFYALSLRDDLAQLIAVGLERNGMTQRELSRIAGYSSRSDSYISRLANAATNFKIGVVARVLIPLGIHPIIVDKAEWDKLKKLERLQKARSSDPSQAQIESTTCGTVIDSKSESRSVIQLWTGQANTPNSSRFAYNVGRPSPLVSA